MTIVVAANPNTPSILVGAKTLRFFKRQSGNNPTTVIKNRDAVRDKSTSTAANRDRRVSARIML
jgi:hypothetical protein